jgi:hypothetical protein
MMMMIIMMMTRWVFGSQRIDSCIQARLFVWCGRYQPRRAFIGRLWSPCVFLFGRVDEDVSATPQQHNQRRVPRKVVRKRSD